MRVLHVHSGNIYGGIEAMLATLAAEPRRGDAVHVSFALCFHGRLADELFGRGADVTLLGAVRLTRPHSVLRARRRLRRLIAHGRPNVVVLHLPWTAAVFGGVLRAAGCRTVLWVHGPGSGWLHRLAARRPPDAVICNSAFTRSTLTPPLAALPGDVIYCPVAVPPPLSETERRRVRADHGANDRAVVIVQASRLEEWKGHAVHLRALARLRDRAGWCLWILGGAHGGDGTYLRHLTKLARELQIADRVRFFGERTDVRRLLAAADICCQPNTAPEPFGVAYVEALAAGLPVVASDLGGVREVVDSSTGVLVAPRDDEALAAVLGDLIEDPARRRRLGANGADRAAALCDPARQTARLHDFLRTLQQPS